MKRHFARAAIDIHPDADLDVDPARDISPARELLSTFRQVSGNGSRGTGSKR